MVKVGEEGWEGKLAEDKEDELDDGKGKGRMVVEFKEEVDDVDGNEEEFGIEDGFEDEELKLTEDEELLQLDEEEGMGGAGGAIFVWNDNSFP